MCFFEYILYFLNETELFSDEYVKLPKHFTVINLNKKVFGFSRAPSSKFKMAAASGKFICISDGLHPIKSVLYKHHVQYPFATGAGFSWVQCHAKVHFWTSEEIKSFYLSLLLLLSAD